MTNQRDVPPGRGKKRPTGNYKNGYGKPPEHGKIRKGEVRNPHGRNGKPKDETDYFEKVMARETRVTIDGETILLTTTEAYFMKMVAMALGGSVAAGRLVQDELNKRRKPGPPPLTAEEIAQAEAEEAQKRVLSAQLVKLLQDGASAKKYSGKPRSMLKDGKWVPFEPKLASDGAASDKKDPG